MGEPLGGVFRRPFEEQVEALRLRLGNQVPTRTWDELWQAEHDRAFVVAGALKADLLADLAEAIRKGGEEGTSLEEFRRDFRATVERNGWPGKAGQGSKKGEAWRTRVIYRTNMATSYASGRMAQLRAAGFPFLVYRHGASREPRLQHLAWDRVVLEADHPFWATHAPPNGWGCSCYVTGARTRAGAKRVGGDPDKALPEGWDAADPRTGAPRGIDRGWAYSPGASVADAIAPVRDKLPKLPPEVARSLLQELLPKLRAPEGADLAHNSQAIIEPAWQEWADKALAGEKVGPGFVGALSPDIVEALRRADRVPASADLWAEPGIVRGKKGRRHVDAGDELSEDEWRSLPALLAQPKAVLLDTETGNLLLVLEGQGPRRSQIVVRIDSRVKVSRERLLANAIISAYRPQLADIESRRKGKKLVLLLGALE